MFLLKFMILALLLSPGLSAQQQVDIGLFSQQDVTGWERRIFSGETFYTLKNENEKWVLSADSQQAASVFYKKITVNLEETPVLNWSWTSRQVINPGNESEKSGDDFVARLYVVKDGGFFFWRTLSINYVWSYQHRKNDFWDSPFAGNKSIMFSLRDSSNPSNTWFFEKRNIVADYETFYGIKLNQIDGIAIMTDSDNSGLSAKAYYGDIYFTAE